MRFLIIISLFLSFALQAQTIKQAKKQDKKLLKEAAAEELVLLNGFAKVMQDYKWSALKELIMEEHIAEQMEMYLTDEVMFNHLGKVGERDTAAVRRFYVRETFGLTQEDEKELLKKKYPHKNFFDLTNLEDGKELFWLKSKDFGEVKIFYFLLYTKTGQSFVGRVMLIDTINGMRLVGPMG